MEQLGSHWPVFSWNCIYMSIFLKSVEQIQFSLKSDKNNGTLHLDQYTFWSYLAQFFLEWKMFQAKVVEKIKTHIVCSITPPENRAVYEPDRPQMTIWRMRIACWITKATDTGSECLITITFPLQQWLHERASMVCYTYIACVVDSY